MQRPSEVQWAERLLRERCPHMFYTTKESLHRDRWRIGWQDTLNLMALAREATSKEMQLVKGRGA